MNDDDRPELLSQRVARCAECIVKGVKDCPHVYLCPICGRYHACHYPRRTPDKGDML